MGNMLLTSKELLALGEDPITSTYNIDRQMEKVLMTREQREAERAQEDAKKQADKEAAEDEEQKKPKFPYTIGTGTRYPILTKYLKENFRNDVMKSPRILEKIAAYSTGKQDETDEVLKILTNTLKPVIEKAVTYNKIPRQDKSYQNLPQIDINEFMSEMQGGAYLNKVITIGKHIADLLEESEDKEAALYIVFAKLCHEITHYLDWLIDDISIECDSDIGYDCEYACFRVVWDSYSKSWDNHIGQGERFEKYDPLTQDDKLDKVTALKNARKFIEAHKTSENELSKTLIPTLPS